jgi:hypothetical protein
MIPGVRNVRHLSPFQKLAGESSLVVIHDAAGLVAKACGGGLGGTRLAALWSPPGGISEERRSRMDCDTADAGTDGTVIEMGARRGEEPRVARGAPENCLFQFWKSAHTVQ